MNSQFNITIHDHQEQEANSRVLKYFTFAFSAYDMKAIEEFLHPEGIFFGKYSRTKALGYFYSLFFGEGGIQEIHCISVNHGWSVHPLPGSEVLEIRCSNFSPHTGEPIRRKFGEPEVKTAGEKVFRFCFEFKEEKIYRIEFSKRFVEQDDKNFKNN